MSGDQPRADKGVSFLKHSQIESVGKGDQQEMAAAVSA